MFAAYFVTVLTIRAISSSSKPTFTHASISQGVRPMSHTLPRLDTWRPKNSLTLDTVYSIRFSASL